MKNAEIPVKVGKKSERWVRKREKVKRGWYKRKHRKRKERKERKERRAKHKIRNLKQKDVTWREIS